MTDDSIMRLLFYILNTSYKNRLIFVTSYKHSFIMYTKFIAFFYKVLANILVAEKGEFSSK